MTVNPESGGLPTYLQERLPRLDPVYGEFLQEIYAPGTETLVRLFSDQFIPGRLQTDATMAVIDNHYRGNDGTPLVAFDMAAAATEVRTWRRANERNVSYEAFITPRVISLLQEELPAEAFAAQIEGIVQANAAVIETADEAGGVRIAGGLCVTRLVHVDSSILEDQGGSLPSLISVIERILPDGTRRHTAYRESTPEHPDAYFFYGPGSPEALSYQKQVNHLGTLALTAETTNEELLLLI